MTTISAAVTPSIIRAAQAAGDFGKISNAVAVDIEATAAKLFSAAAAADLSEAKAASPAGAPQLRQPNVARAAAGVGLTQAQAQTLTNEGWLALLMGQLMELLGEVSAESVRSRLALLKAQSEVQKASFERLADAYGRAEAQYGDALSIASEAADEALRAMTAASAAAERVNQLRAQLQGMSPSDPGYSDLQAQVQQAEAEAVVLHGRAQNAVTRSDQAAAEVNAAMDEVARLRGEVDRLAMFAPPALSSPSTRTNAASVIELMAKLNQIAADAGLAKLQSDSKLAVALMNERAAENRRIAEEQEAKEAKAAQMNKVMGCIGKILGFLVAAVSLVVGAVGAIFSGGLSMAGAISLSVAVIGLVMSVVAEATKFSVLGEAIKPFVEHVIQPLIKAIGNLLTKLLADLGVDEATARKVGGILGAVVAAILIVVAAVAIFVVGRSAAAELLKQIGPMIQKLVQNLVPQVLKNVGKGLAQGVANVTAKVGAAAAKTLGSSVDDMAVNVGRITVATQVTGVVNSVAQGAGAAVVADMHVEVAELQADLSLGLELARIVSQMLEGAQDEFSKLNDLILHQMEKLTEVASDRADSGRAIIHNMRGAAGAA